MNVDISDIQDPDVASLAREAESFLRAHRWCERVVGGHKAWAVPGVLGVFHFDIGSNRPGVDSSLWVVVGDLPAAYIAQASGASWQDVLAGYVYEMRRWVDAVRSGRSVEDLIPVDVEPTIAHADLLASRLDFIDAELVSAPAESFEDTD